MLIKALVENFKSFNRPTELTMITSNKIRVKGEHEIQIKKLKLLKNAVIYGANASGKSNLVELFYFLKYCLEKKIPVGGANLFCKLEKENISRPSTFEIQFSVGENIYDYGFSVVINERKIVEEWLYELKVNDEPSCVFEYKEGSLPVLGLKGILKEDASKFRTYAEDYQESKGVLFLTELNRNKKYHEESKLFIIKEIYNWLTKNLIVFKSDVPITDFGYFYNENSLEIVNKLIRVFDTGIANARIVNISLEELKRKLPIELFESVMSKIEECIEKGDKHCRFSMRSSDEFFNIEIYSNQEPSITTIKLTHENSYFDYDFEEESDGTRRLFDLLDMLLVSNDDIVFVMDELERSLHPKLTERFLQLFSEIHKNRKIQLIFTTHEASIMDQELFRRDEIWFVERDAKNCSHIYSLDKFKERYDKKLSKAYLEGRYGAIPVFKSFSFKGE